MYDNENLIESFVKIKLSNPDDFLKIKETLTRVGVASKKDKKLYQSCHILHKRGEYYIVHFKELFMLDGKESDFSEEDLARRNTIANLLSEWGLLKLADIEKSKEPTCPVGNIKILPFAEKPEWTLVPKYIIGRYKKKSE